MTRTTFLVDPVQANKTPEDIRWGMDALTAFRNAKVKGVEACGMSQNKVSHAKSHAVVGAMHMAYAHHNPLVLSPDDIWVVLAQAFATHVNLNTEALRDRFARHEGKQDLVVYANAFVKGSPDNDWPTVFGQFSDKIAEFIGQTRDLVVSEFSTTGPIEKVVSECVLMDAMQGYFGYVCRTLCGIPSITLLGTVGDWASIRNRARVFAEYGLEEWISKLIPILDQFIIAKMGKANRDFWTGMYKMQDDSSGPFVSGWVNTLFPYIKGWSPEKNTHVMISNPWCQSPWKGKGPTLGAFPQGLTSVPFVWEYLGTKYPMSLLGGFTGVHQDQKNCEVRPVMGWAVANR